MAEDILDRAEKALAGITEGPWIVSGRWSYYDHMLYVEREGAEICYIASRDDGDNDAPDAPVMGEALANTRFIAASPDLVRDLAAEVRRLREGLRKIASYDDEGASNALAELEGVLSGLLPWLEDAETKSLVGDEGCLWGAEHVRAALAGKPSQPTDEDVEAAARAIYAIRPFVVASTSTTMGAQIGRTFDWDGAPHYYQQDMRGLARAALEARGR
ncbi:MAG: hypothetical protein GC201_18885 [Alphaproteobacteria bacterium]|nr:hypothetical protein [Alphaproteobacteria bacterium]